MFYKIFYRIILLYLFYSFPLLCSHSLSGFIKFSPDPEELWVELKYKNYKTIFFTAYSSDTTIYIPFGKTFSFLKIKSNSSINGSVFEGFLVRENDKYRIDFQKKEIVFRNNPVRFSDSDVYFKDEYYINIKILKTVFELDLVYDKKDQSFTLKTGLNLPVDIYHNRMIERTRLSKKKDIEPAGFFYRRERAWLKGGFVNWALGYYYNRSGNLLLYSLGIGAELMGGDIQTYINSSNRTNIDWKNVPWKWRYVAQERPYFQQLIAGDINLNSQPNYMIRGLQVSNVPIEPRITFIKDSVHGITNPLWETEIYTENNLCEYKITDSTGIYGFEIPVNYGLSSFNQKFFGLNGEERSIEKINYVPFSFIPPGEFDYTLTLGKLKYFNRQNSFQVDLGYGLLPSITLNGGVQYFEGNKINPFASLNYRLLDNLYIAGEYYNNNMIRFYSKYYSISNIQASIDLRKYSGNSFFYPQKSKYQAMFTLSIPVKEILSNSGFNLYLNKYVFEDYDYFYGSAGFNTYFKGLSTGMEIQSYHSAFNNYLKKSATLAAISLSKSLLWNIYCQSRMSIDLNDRKTIRFQLSLNRNINDLGFCDLSFSRYGNINNLFFNLHFNFSYLEANTSITNSNSGYSFSQNVSGTFAYDHGARNMEFCRDNWIGKGNLTVIPFIDNNDNGIYDDNEQSLSFSPELNPGTSLNFRKYPSRNGLLQLTDMVPYCSYKFAVDPLSMGDPLWKPRYRNILVEIDPNSYKAVYLPFCYSGIVSGDVKDETRRNFIFGDLKIKFKNISTLSEVETDVFSDGSFYYEGIFPGKYLAIIDSLFLEKKQIVPADTVKFEIKPNPPGNYIENISFILKSRKSIKALANLSGRIVLQKPNKSADTLNKAVGVKEGIFSRYAVEILKERINMIKIADSNGNFSFSGVPPGKWMLRILGESIIDKYKPEEECYYLDLEPNGTHFIDIRMISKEPEIVAFERLKPRIRPNVTGFIYYDERKKSFDPNTKDYLDGIIDYIKNKPGSIIRIDGHTDNQGLFTEKQSRSERNAVRVKNYLLNKGVKPSAIYIRGWGDRRPLNPNTSSKERTKNNRVEIRVENK